MRANAGFVACNQLEIKVVKEVIDRNGDLIDHAYVKTQKGNVVNESFRAILCAILWMERNKKKNQNGRMWKLGAGKTENLFNASISKRGEEISEKS